MRIGYHSDEIGIFLIQIPGLVEIVLVKCFGVISYAVVAGQIIKVIRLGRIDGRFQTFRASIGDWRWGQTAIFASIIWRVNL